MISIHSAVGRTLLVNHFGPFKLLTKQQGFDWSLGPDIGEIGRKHGADYALFVYYRDYQASGGRVAPHELSASISTGRTWLPAPRPSAPTSRSGPRCGPG